MAKPRNQSKPTKQKIKPDQKQQPQQSWGVVRGLLLTCKHSNDSQATTQHLQKQGLKKQKQIVGVEELGNNKSKNKKKSNKKIKCSGSLCSNTKVMHRPPDQNQSQVSPTDLHKKLSSNANNEASSRSMKVNENVVSTSTSSSTSSSSSSTLSSSSSSFRGGMGLRRLSGCYECRMVVDPVLGFARDPSLRATICTCPHCGDIFMNAENLELHQAVTHAVSELGAEDTSKNIVEIIFQSSWLKKKQADNNNNNGAAPAACPKIERILKVHNTQTTVANFESYRDAVKSRASPRRPNPRCVADGNELLRFHAATFGCSLGLNGSTALCGNIPQCHVCAIIKSGFKVASRGGGGILTTATSGTAHDGVGGGERRAMLVCRVIAGRVKKANANGIESNNNNNGNNLEDYDSVAGANNHVGVFSHLDELYVFNPRAILPCFVVIYSGF